MPTHAVVEDSPEQVLFVHRRAAVIERWGHEAPAPLIRSSAGSRAAIMAASDGKYDFRGHDALANMKAGGVEVVALGTGGDPFHAAARSLYESLGFTPFPGVYYFKAI